MEGEEVGTHRNNLSSYNSEKYCDNKMSVHMFWKPSYGAIDASFAVSFQYVCTFAPFIILELVADIV